MNNSIIAVLVFLFGFAFVFLGGAVYALLVFLFVIGFLLTKLRPFSWFYFFLLLFSFLGVVFKLTFHMLFDYSYIEPIGQFSGSAKDWSIFYSYALSLGFSFVAAKVLLWVVFRFCSISLERPVIDCSMPAPRLVDRSQWIGFVIFGIFFYLINSEFAFFVTGINAKVALPFGLGALLAFFAFSGFYLVGVLLFCKDSLSRGGFSSFGFLSLCVFSAVASVSMSSRAVMILQILPIIFVLKARYDFLLHVYRRQLFFAFFLIVLSLVAVSCIRFFGSIDAEGGFASYVPYFMQTFTLIVDRWVGVEPIMVASSTPDASLGLFFRILGEDPGVGIDGIYQNISGANYAFVAGKTFLSLPGIYGVLSISGSPLLFFFVFVLLILLVSGFEFFFGGLYREAPYFLAAFFCLLANSVAQISFPLLLIPFFVQMVLVYFLGVVFFRRYP